MDKLLKSILPQDTGSVSSSTPNVKRKKIKETSSTEGENISLVRSHSTSMKKVESSAKKKKKKVAHDSLTNGHLDGDHKEGDGQEVGHSSLVRFYAVFYRGKFASNKAKNG